VKYVTTERIEPFDWYPMETFERLGLAILDHIVGSERDAIRLWGRSRLEGVVQALPDLVVANDPAASIEQFHGFFRDSFDFETLRLVSVSPGRLQLQVDYAMSPRAEEAAAWQTAGFFETVITASGGLAVRSTLEPHDWASGGPATFVLTWQGAAPVVAEPAAAALPKVLVVDDQRLVAQAMQRILRPVAEVTTASSAAEAITLLEAQRFDGVLSDFAMPGRDGLWLLGEVARRWPETRRVLQSADPPAAAQAAKAAGVVHEVLHKPAPIDEIRAAFARK
jgi:CheY-like chemotaxis protein